MVTNKTYIYKSILLLIFISCSKTDKSLIEGHWRAFEIYEDDIRLDTDLSEVSFTFQDDQYSYFNTVHLEENGTYEILGDKLIVIDTSRHLEIKKTVQIVLLTQDSLHIRMNAGGKEQVLKLFRAGIEDEEAPIIME